MCSLQRPIKCLVQRSFSYSRDAASAMPRGRLLGMLNKTKASFQFQPVVFIAPPHLPGLTHPSTSLHVTGVVLLPSRAAGAFDWLSRVCWVSLWQLRMLSICLLLLLPTAWSLQVRPPHLGPRTSSPLRTALCPGWAQHCQQQFPAGRWCFYSWFNLHFYCCLPRSRF